VNRRYSTIEDRIIANSVLDPESECWIWIGRRDRNGYGKINVRDGRKHVTAWAHRVAYEAFVGPIPKRMSVDHTCACAACVNPAHLRLLTISANTADRNVRWAKQKRAA
jgi:hypothetical protein